MNKILCTDDWHIRSTIPVCRNDDFLKVQKETLLQIYDIAEKHKAKVIIAGDIFNKARPEKAQELEIMLIDIMERFYTDFIPGQHDLLYHKIENLNKGSLGVVSRSLLFHNNLSIIKFHYGQEIENGKGIAVLHKFIAEKELPFFMDGLTAKELCEKYDYEVFITGDNHHGFIYTHPETKQIVINSGCITRQESTLKNYKPRVYILDIVSKEIETVYLCDNDPLVIIEIDEEKKKDRLERIDSFVEKLKNTKEVLLDFEKNYGLYKKKEKVKKEVDNIILRSFTGKYHE